MSLDEFVVKIQSGEISSKEEISRVIKLLMNKNGSDVNELRERVLSGIEYSTDKIIHNEKQYIAVDSIKEMLAE